MQDRRETDLRKVEQIMEESKGGVLGKKDTLVSKQAANEAGNNPANAAESSTALQQFLDCIPISSIPGINNSSAADELCTQLSQLYGREVSQTIEKLPKTCPKTVLFWGTAISSLPWALQGVMELRTDDCLGDAIRLLYEKNVFGAPIAVDALDVDTAIIGRKFSDEYIGFIDFARMVLWSLEECERSDTQTKEESNNGFFSMLEQNPHIAHTKIGELAKSFLWDHFFPVHLDATLFHVLLLLSKHQVQFVPVTEQSCPKVIGFVTQNAVIQLLLQSSGLEWFDSIADKALSEFRFENDKRAVFVFGNQSIAEVMHILWQSQMGAVAVLERGTKRLIGCMRNIDLHLLLDNKDLFNNRKSLTVEEFIRMDRSEEVSEPTLERDIGAFLSAGVLILRNTFLPKMESPITNKKTDTLKQAMNNLASAKGNFCFLVDELQQVQGMVTLRDMIIQFAPPSIDSTINGGGFFDSALEQAGCHIEKGTMICDH